ncbi:HK97-gp10 family putative phage morphogenesis protein [Enterobacter cloacae complex sp. 379K3]|uniref:HK97-gp10 family putative phage morphogenesis protein n=1 Tax=Enterobacter cloacae complex sp. 379K3 TaxID=3395865 RepID=UPI003CF64079
MQMDIKFPTGKEFDRLLESIDKKVGVKLLRDAGRAALAVVEQDMRQHAGFDEESIGPHMRDSIKIRSTNVAETSRYNTIVTLRVGPSKIHHMKAVAQIGTVKQVADPFIRPAMDYNVEKILKVLAAEIRLGLEGR